MCFIPVELSSGKGTAVLPTDAPCRITQSTTAGLLLLETHTQRQHDFMETLWTTAEQKSLMDSLTHWLTDKLTDWLTVWVKKAELTLCISSFSSVPLLRMICLSAVKRENQWDDGRLTEEERVCVCVCVIRQCHLSGLKGRYPDWPEGLLFSGVMVPLSPSWPGFWSAVGLASPQEQCLLTAPPAADPQKTKWQRRDFRTNLRQSVPCLTTFDPQSLTQVSQSPAHPVKTQFGITMATHEKKANSSMDVCLGSLSCWETNVGPTKHKPHRTCCCCSKTLLCWQPSVCRRHRQPAWVELRRTSLLYFANWT